MARRWMTLGAGLLLAGAASLPAQAQSVADFYRGKTVNVLIGVGVEEGIRPEPVARAGDPLLRAVADDERVVALQLAQRAVSRMSPRRRSIHADSSGRQ